MLQYFDFSIIPFQLLQIFDDFKVVLAIFLLYALLIALFLLVVLPIIIITFDWLFHLLEMQLY